MCGFWATLRECLTVSRLEALARDLFTCEPNEADAYLQWMSAGTLGSRFLRGGLVWLS